MSALTQRIIEMAKPKMIPPPDHKEIGEDIKRKVITAHKKGGIAIGECYHNYDPKTGKHSITMEHDGGSHYTMDETLSEHPRVKSIDFIKHYQGHYDWAADHYIKDSTVAEFTVK